MNDHMPLSNMRNDPAVYRHISGKPSTEEENWRKLMATLGHWRLMGFGYWAIEEHSTGKTIGEIGFADFQRDMSPSLAGTLEAGWALASQVHGLGYALEALAAALNWAHQNFPRTPVTCLIAPENTASIKLATRAGFTERCRCSYQGEDNILMDWKRPLGLG